MVLLLRVPAKDRGWGVGLRPHQLPHEANLSRAEREEHGAALLLGWAWNTAASVTGQQQELVGPPSLELSKRCSTETMPLTRDTLFSFPSSRKKKTDQFLRDAVETRLRMLIPYIEHWPRVQSPYLGHRATTYSWS